SRRGRQAGGAAALAAGRGGVAASRDFGTPAGFQRGGALKRGAKRSTTAAPGGGGGAPGGEVSGGGGGGGGAGQGAAEGGGAGQGIEHMLPRADGGGVAQHSGLAGPERAHEIGNQAIGRPVAAADDVAGAGAAEADAPGRIGGAVGVDGQLGRGLGGAVGLAA